MKNKPNYFLIGSFIVYSILVGVFSYTQIYQGFLKVEEKRVRTYLNEAASAAAQIIDLSDVNSIVTNLNNGISGKEIESSDYYKNLQDSLNRAQKIFPDSIGWYYILAPSEDKNSSKFLLLYPDTSIASDAERSYPGDAYDISAYKEMKEAFEHEVDKTEPESGIGYDTTYEVYIVSAYKAIFFEGKYLGILGIDCFSKSYEKMTSDGVLFASAISGAILLIAILIPLAGFLTYTRIIFPFFETRRDVHFKRAQDLKKILKKSNNKHS